MIKKYSKVNKTDIDSFIEIIGKNNVFFDEETLKNYSTDHTENLSFFPEIVIKPINSIEISKIIKYCNKRLIPITPSENRKTTYVTNLLDFCSLI